MKIDNGLAPGYVHVNNGGNLYGWDHTIAGVSSWQNMIYNVHRLIRCIIPDIRMSCVLLWLALHYNDVILSAMASQITSLTIVYSTVYSRRRSKKHQSSASLAFVTGSHRRPVNSPLNRPVTRKMSSFDDVIMRTFDNIIQINLIGKRPTLSSKTDMKIMGYQSRQCIQLVISTTKHTQINSLRPRQMDAIFQTTFSNAFSSIKMYEFLLKFHWSLFLGVQFTIFHHWLR